MEGTKIEDLRTGQTWQFAIEKEEIFLITFLAGEFLADLFIDQSKIRWMRATLETGDSFRISRMKKVLNPIPVEQAPIREYEKPLTERKKRYWRTKIGEQIIDNPIDHRASSVLITYAHGQYEIKIGRSDFLENGELEHFHLYQAPWKEEEIIEVSVIDPTLEEGNKLSSHPNCPL